MNLLSIILISCLGSVLYSNTFHCSFHLDDQTSIIYNFAIRNIHNLANIWDFLPRHFILNLSFALNYYFNGLDIVGYHVFNLAVHLLTAILVWRLTFLTLSTPAMKGDKIIRHSKLIALLAGLVFVSHPVQTEAVTYIVQRAASMAALFYAASLCFYVQSRLLQISHPERSEGSLYYILALVTAIMAMFTKETAITLPLVIVLYEYSFFKGKGRMNWKYTIPFMFTLFIIPVTMLLTESAEAQKIRGVVGEGPVGISPVQYFLTQLRVLVTYIRLVFLPFNQNLDYDYPLSKTIFELPVAISFLFLAVILFYAKRLFLKYRLVSFSIFFFFLALLPESSFLPIKDVIFEHRLYLPLIGYSIFLVSALYYLLGQKNIKTMTVILTAVILLNSVLTYQRNKVWADEFSLWSDAAGKSPHKARPYNGLGIFYSKQGALAEAVSDFDKAVAINPYYTEAYNNRANVYDQQGHFTQALSDFSKVIEIEPLFAGGYYDRALAYDQQGDFAQAISNYDKAIELNPRYADAYVNRGIVYFKQDHLMRAMSDYTKAIEISPMDANAYYDRGLIYEKQNDIARAMSAYNKTIDVDPDFANAYNKRGEIYSRQGNFDQALSDFNKAIDINPGFWDAYNNRGDVFSRKGNLNQALSDFNKAVEIEPSFAAGFYNRANTYAHLGRLAQALLDYNKAIRINPAYTAAYYNRTIVYNALKAAASGGPR